MVEIEEGKDDEGREIWVFLCERVRERGRGKLEREAEREM
jgi:hypothetical protein